MASLAVDRVQSRLPTFVATNPMEAGPLLSAAGELRFEIGRTVECRLGPDAWARGTVVGHYYRETDWPEGQKAPYQVLLEGDNLTARTIWAPSDTDECIRAANRFPVGASVECCVGVESWVRGTVVAHYYREADWPAQLLAPYRVRIESDDAAENDVYIWAPIDTDECIRAAANESKLLELGSRAGGAK